MPQVSMPRKNEFTQVWRQSADLDHWTADIERARVILAASITKSITKKWGTAIAAERATGISHTELSRIRNGRLARYTVDRLARLLHAVDPTVEVRVEVKVKLRQRTYEPKCEASRKSMPNI
jgi:predicted XRE-type DNA-binding protein